MKKSSCIWKYLPIGNLLTNKKSHSLIGNLLTNKQSRSLIGNLFTKQEVTNVHAPILWKLKTTSKMTVELPVKLAKRSVFELNSNTSLYIDLIQNHNLLKVSLVLLLVLSKSPNTIKALWSNSTNQLITYHI